MPVGSSFWIADGMLAGEIENLQGADGEIKGYRFALRNRFLHGHHPLGWIRDLSVLVDGVQIPRQSLFLLLRGQWIGARQVPTIYDIWWQMNETIHIAVTREGGITGGSHSVELILTVSSLNHTPVLDRGGLYPTVTVPLAASLEVATTPAEGAFF